MSNGIRHYEPDPDWFNDASQLDVRAVVGGDDHGPSIQLTIGSEFIVLTEKQVLDLIGVCSKRLAMADGFSGTDVLDEYTVAADGSKEVKETTW